MCAAIRTHTPRRLELLLRPPAAETAHHLPSRCSTAGAPRRRAESAAPQTAENRARDSDRRCDPASPRGETGCSAVAAAAAWSRRRRIRTPCGLGRTGPAPWTGRAGPAPTAPDPSILEHVPTEETIYMRRILYIRKATEGPEIYIR